MMSELFGNNDGFLRLSGEALPSGRATNKRKDPAELTSFRQTAGRDGKTVTVITNFIGIGLPEKNALPKKSKRLAARAEP